MPRDIITPDTIKGFFACLGVMACLFSIKDSIDYRLYYNQHRSIKEHPSDSFLKVIQSILKFITFPIGFFVEGHDHIQSAKEIDRHNKFMKSYTDSVKQERKQYQDKISALEDQLLEETFEAKQMGRMDGEHSGYVQGYQDGFRYAVNLTSISTDTSEDRQHELAWICYRNAHSNADNYVKMLKEQEEMDK